MDVEQERPRDACPICGETMTRVRLFTQEWWECSASILLALRFGETAHMTDAERKHLEHDAAKVPAPRPPPRA